MCLSWFKEQENQENKMKVTVDTNFLISATQWDYSIAHKLLKKLILSDAQISATQDILDETSEVLERDFKYSKDEAKNIIEKNIAFCESDGTKTENKCRKR